MEIEANPETDLFSNLPINITETILIRLPLRDAVRTSILSRDWRYKWITMPELVFDGTGLLRPSSSIELTLDNLKRVNVIDQVLLRHRGQIEKFGCSNYMDTCSDIDRWILYLSGQAIKVFILKLVSGMPYKLPSCFYAWKGLHQLELAKCIFKPPLTSYTLPNMRIISFFSVTIVQDSFELFISKCPRLERMELSYTYGHEHLKITAPCLQNLILSGGELKSLSFEKPTSLKVVNIHTCTVKGVMDLELNGTSDLVKTLGGLINIRSLQMCSSFFQNSTLGEVTESFPTTFDHLKHLSVGISWPAPYQVPGMLCLFRCSPNLQDLEIFSFPSDYVEDDAELVASLWEAEDLDLLLNKLQTVKFAILGLMSELEFLKYILVTAPVLERIDVKIQGDWAVEMTEQVTIFTELMKFRRASPRAQIVYLGLL